MAEVLDRFVESELLDLTQVSLADLSAVSMPDAFDLLDRALAHPAQDQQEQAN